MSSLLATLSPLENLQQRIVFTIEQPCAIALPSLRSLQYSDVFTSWYIWNYLSAVGRLRRRGLLQKILSHRSSSWQNAGLTYWLILRLRSMTRLVEMVGELFLRIERRLTLGAGGRVLQTRLMDEV